jgi:hypothetical protein
MKYCQERGFRSIGMLKFLVHKEGQDKLSDNAGTLNLTIARQLELGLLLANDPLKPIGIIEGASAVAAQTPAVNHLTREGRLKLFELDYPLAWGKEKVKADAFLTGVVGISGDLKTLKIQFHVFDQKSNKLESLGGASRGRERPAKTI